MTGDQSPPPGSCISGSPGRSRRAVRDRSGFAFLRAGPPAGVTDRFGPDRPRSGPRRSRPTDRRVMAADGRDPTGSVPPVGGRSRSGPAAGPEEQSGRVGRNELRPPGRPGKTRYQVRPRPDSSDSGPTPSVDRSQHAGGRIPVKCRSSSCPSDGSS
jgi:hypothetical protein